MNRRDLTYEITKLQLLSEDATEFLKDEIFKIEPNVKRIKHFKSWFKKAHNLSKGIPDTSNGYTTDDFMGYLDAIHKLNYDIDLVLKGTKKWKKNTKRDRAIENWLAKIDINTIYPDEIQDDNIFEGTKKQIVVNAYERSSKARKECIEEYGYKCTICKFDFEKIYGEIGKNFIHIHHLKPLSEIDEKYKINPIKDLRPVCPNCHAMLHKKNPPYSIEEIQNLLTKKTYNKTSRL